jgi:hypothetical protein
MREPSEMFLKAFVVLCVLAGTFQARSEDRSDKFAIFLAGNSAQPVVKSLSKLLNDSRSFKVVDSTDSAKVTVLLSCLDRQDKEPLVCMYIAQYVGASFSTMLGAGMHVATDADDVAMKFLKCIAADIAERWNETDKTNLRQSLEACLFLSESDCDVPKPLQKSLGSEKISLRQYLFQKKQ